MKRAYTVLLYALAALCLALVFRLLSGPIVFSIVTGDESQHYSNANTGTEDGSPDWMRWLDLTAQWVMALGTLALLSWTVRSIRAARKATDDAMIVSKNALDATKEATRETARSVDAFIEAERGKVTLYAIHLDPNGPVINFSFLNTGRSPVKTTSPEHGIFVLHKDAPFVYRAFAFNKDPGPLVHIVAAGEEFRTWDVQPDKSKRMAPFSLSDITQAGWEAIKSGVAVLYFCVYMDYETTDGVWRTVSVNIFDPNMEEGQKVGWFFPAPANDLTYDIKVFDRPVARG